MSKTNRYSQDYDLDTDPDDLADTWDLACEISDHELSLVGDPDYDTVEDYLADREREESSW